MSLDLAAEQLLILQDWAETLTHETVGQEYDVTTQTVVETIVSHELAAIVLSRSQTPTAGTAEQHQTVVITFLARDEQWPDDSPGKLRRLVYQGKRYDVLAKETAELSGFSVVTARFSA